jgi:putative transcriptional regulator
MEDLQEVGGIDKITMRDFALGCLTPVEPLAPLALNVTPTVVSRWERGEARPSGPSLKLLALAEKKGVEAIL